MRLLAILALVLIGCSPVATPVRVIPPAGSSPDRVRRLNAAVSMTVDDFRAREGTRVPGVMILVEDRPFMVGGVGPCNGYWFIPNTIMVWAGDYDECPALYHELAHRCFWLENHDDPRWPTWDARGSEVATRIKGSVR